MPTPTPTPTPDPKPTPSDDDTLSALVKAAKVDLVKATAQKNGKIKLTFKGLTLNNGKKVDTYQIYRKVKGGEYKRFATVKRTSDANTWTNAKKLKKGKKYYYKVRGRVQLSSGKYVYTKWSNVKSAKCLKTR